MIKELNVRLVAIYHRVMAEAINIPELADLLELGEKLWLLGYCVRALIDGNPHIIVVPFQVQHLSLHCMNCNVGTYWQSLVEGKSI
jgi:hypothetical protein